MAIYAIDLLADGRVLAKIGQAVCKYFYTTGYVALRIMLAHPEIFFNNLPILGANLPFEFLSLISHNIGSTYLKFTQTMLLRRHSLILFGLFAYSLSSSRTLQSCSLTIYIDYKPQKSLIMALQILDGLNIVGSSLISTLAAKLVHNVNAIHLTTPRRFGTIAPFDYTKIPGYTGNKSCHTSRKVSDLPPPIANCSPKT